jgi:hypothetical protein
MNKISLVIVALLCGSSVAGCSQSEYYEVPKALSQQTLTYFAPPHYPDYAPAISDDAAATGN